MAWSWAGKSKKTKSDKKISKAQQKKDNKDVSAFAELASGMPKYYLSLGLTEKELEGLKEADKAFNYDDVKQLKRELQEAGYNSFVMRTGFEEQIKHLNDKIEKLQADVKKGEDAALLLSEGIYKFLSGKIDAVILKQYIKGILKPEWINQFEEKYFPVDYENRLRNANSLELLKNSNQHFDSDDFNSSLDRMNFKNKE